MGRLRTRSLLLAVGVTAMLLMIAVGNLGDRVAVAGESGEIAVQESTPAHSGN